MARKLEKKGKRIQTERVVLRALAGLGIISIAFLAPKVISALKKIDPNWEHKLDPRMRVNQAFYRLKRKGLIEKNKKGFAVTRKGRRFLDELEEGDLKIARPVRWDGRWRLVIFDIAEQRRGKRHTLRRLLRHIGFIQLQASVWIYPYDCEEVVALIKSEHRLGREVHYIIADVVENDGRLRKHFHLRPT